MSFPRGSVESRQKILTTTPCLAVLVARGLSGTTMSKDAHFQALQRAGPAPVGDQEGLLAGSETGLLTSFRGQLAGQDTCLNVLATNACQVATVKCCM